MAKTLVKETKWKQRPAPPNEYTELIISEQSYLIQELRGLHVVTSEKCNEVPERTSLCINFNDKRNGNIRSE